jgi:hypothetical protein
MAQVRPQSRRSSALPLAALLLPIAAGLLWTACAGPGVPDTTPGLACRVDDDCDPEDNCIAGHCTGNSAGAADAGAVGADAGAADAGAHDAGSPDAGEVDAGQPDAGADAGPADAGAHDAGTADAGAHDAGSPDAGAADAGAHDAGSPDAGSPDAGAVDAGPAPSGKLTLSPAHSDLSVTAGAAPSPVILSAGNSGNATLHFSVSCTAGTASPSTGSIAQGAAVSVTIALPAYSQTGTQSPSCTVTSSDASSGTPATWTATVTVNPVVTPGPIGPNGGSVDLLNFSFTGDTRPTSCDNTSGYPGAAFQTILTTMSGPQFSPQFALDLGDHMFVCSGGLTTARTQMKIYTDALAAKWPAALPWFMTMGNHECNSGGGSQVCGTTDVNYVAFQEALVAVSKHDNPNYKVDIQTRLGLVRIVFAADNQATQADVDQLKAWMTEADTKAYALFVAKHHTVAVGSRTGPTWVLTDLIEGHRVTAILVAHDHKYYRSSYARTGSLGGSVPAVVCGLGAANTSYRGFCRMQQKADGSFDMIKYDDAGNPGDTWNLVGKQ